MSYIKSKIFLNLSKTQKTALCNYIRAKVKISTHLSTDELCNNFFEDEDYYINIGNPHFSFIKDFINNSFFKKEVKLYIDECLKLYKYKESQKPLIELQKKYEKEKRVFLREVKMSKENPTKKQLYYYDCLCKKYNIEKQNTDEMSKLDIKREIGRIIDEHSRDS